MPKCSHLSKLAAYPHTTIQSRLLLSFQSIPISPFSSSSSSSSSKPTSTLLVPSHEHITHLILDQKSASQALQTFKWASSLPNYTHSQSTYRALVHRLCTFRRFGDVVHVLDEMPHKIGSPPDEGIFLTMIRGLGRTGMVRDVIKVLDLVTKFSQIPSLKIFNSILDVLVKEDIDLARAFYRRKMMRSGVKGDDYTFGILMKGLCLTNRIGDGFKLLQVIKDSGVRPNTVIYNTLLHALCRNGKVGRARSLMSEMEDPNDVTFNVLIGGYCKEDNLVQALVLLERSFSLGYVPDIITVTKVMEMLCNVGRVGESAEILERVERHGGSVDVVAYNTLIEGFCKLGKVKVGYHFLKEMERKGCLPNVDTYNTLISGFCQNGMLDLALDMFNDMKMDGISWNFATYDTLIRGFFSGGRLEDGFKILEMMEETKGGSGGRISPYNSVLYGLYKTNQWDEGLEFLMKMETMFPRAVDRCLGILGLCAEGAIEDARRVYDEITAEGGVANALVYDSLIHAFCQEGCVREAVELMNEMVGQDYVPVALTFNAIISEFCRQGKDGSALKLLEDMVGRGCVPNAESYNPLIDSLCRTGNFEKALDLFLQMIENGITPTCIMWDALILCLSQQRVWNESKAMICLDNKLQKIIEI
ncbi:hypothetical protein Tsubulata_021411 [Turnera subulata]|uniref:Pentacotripeptide-repeat region of PRORP domain-containing protein n=1 Tax=Turnera subulata TaxID=218843 RepID=A0A9Q0G9B3_9ROSI|nr:hypothetical protein Tsubulata_021411 [Turnera subulata]